MVHLIKTGLSAFWKTWKTWKNHGIWFGIRENLEISWNFIRNVLEIFLIGFWNFLIYSPIYIPFKDAPKSAVLGNLEHRKLKIFPVGPNQGGSSLKPLHITSPNIIINDTTCFCVWDLYLSRLDRLQKPFCRYENHGNFGVLVRENLEKSWKFAS